MAFSGIPHWDRGMLVIVVLFFAAWIELLRMGGKEWWEKKREEDVKRQNALRKKPRCPLCGRILVKEGCPGSDCPGPRRASDCEGQKFTKMKRIGKMVLIFILTIVLYLLLLFGSQLLIAEILRWVGVPLVLAYIGVLIWAACREAKNSKKPH
jgi:hypothetical protein